MLCLLRGELLRDHWALGTVCLLCTRLFFSGLGKCMFGMPCWQLHGPGRYCIVMRKLRFWSVFGVGGRYQLHRLPVGSVSSQHRLDKLRSVPSRQLLLHRRALGYHRVMCCGYIFRKRFGWVLNVWCRILLWPQCRCVLWLRGGHVLGDVINI